MNAGPLDTRYRIGVDIGGTFTDFALLKGAEVILHKNLSTPEDRSIGVMDGLEKLAAIEGLTLKDFLGQCEAIVHGTTIADNTLIEMNGALTGLITTEGFRDEMEYRRGYKEDIWDVRLPPPQPITPRRRRGAERVPTSRLCIRRACPLRSGLNTAPHPHRRRVLARGAFRTPSRPWPWSAPALS